MYKKHENNLNAWKHGKCPIPLGKYYRAMKNTYEASVKTG